MTTPHYPAITEASLTPIRALELQLPKIPDLLERAECPYPPAIKATLRRLVTRAGGEGGSLGAVKGDVLTQADDATLDEEIAALYRTVKTDSSTFVGTDIKDRMSFLKTSNDLLTKLVDLQARRFNIRNMARMQRIVVEHMEEFLDPGQRTAFIAKIEGLTDV